MMLFQLQGFQTASIIPKWGLQSKRSHLQHYHSVHLPLFLALYSTPSPPMPAGVCKHPLWSRELAANTTCWCCSDEFRVLHNLIRQTINFAEMSFGDEKLWLYGPRRRKGWGPGGGEGDDNSTLWDRSLSSHSSLKMQWLGKDIVFAKITLLVSNFHTFFNNLYPLTLCFFKKGIHCSFKNLSKTSPASGEAFGQNGMYVHLYQSPLNQALTRAYDIKRVS